MFSQNITQLFDSLHRDTADYDYGVSSQQVLNDLSEVERDLQLRRLLWESSEEWGTLVEEWTATQFDQLNVDLVQKNVNKFTQTVYMLEKGKLLENLLTIKYSEEVQLERFHQNS